MMRATPSRLRNWTGFAIVAIVLLAPVPMASNRPVFWLGATVAIAALATLYFGLVALRPQARDRSRRPLGVFLLAGLVIVWALIQGLIVPGPISLAPGSTLLGALRLTGYLLIFALTLEIARRQSRANWMAWALFWGVGAHAVWALLSLNVLGDQFFWGEKAAYRGMATGTFINRNAFATFLAMGLVLGLSLIRARGRGPMQFATSMHSVLQTVLIWLALMVLLFASVSTGSRLGFMATAIGLLVVMAIPVGTGQGRVHRIGAVIFGVSLLVPVLALGAGLAERLPTLWADAGVRLALYDQIWGMIATRPITGFGLDAFPAAYELFQRPPVSADVVWNYAHSTYLQLWMELGLIIGSIPPLIGLLLVRQLGRRIRNGRDIALPVAGLAALIVGGLHSVADFPLEIPANMYLLTVLVALGVAPQRRVTTPDTTG